MKTARPAGSVAEAPGTSIRIISTVNARLVRLTQIILVGIGKINRLSKWRYTL